MAERRVVAILRARDADRFAAVSDVLLEAGVPVVEFTMTSRGAVDALRDYAARRAGEVVLGAGTVLTPEQARESVDAGATYLVTPAVCPDVVAEGQRLGVPVLPGALTPTEILGAARAGAAAVKVFPASLGGPPYIKAVRAPLPDIPLVPTGGVGIADVRSYLEAGALAVGLGGPLVGDSCDGGDLGTLADRARAVVAEAAGVNQ
ncbi:MAG: bifunctional 4-hydroxy-2-oxoglutarate aldolase/2-dehydro-3-deoxy-phosphogluconate aldolase [Streptosporangiales bacterium]|nr:bifunctional 4-hydroxy-2-oxoglutarate aldolase/2-dehydro-3-deoxy-phosphogluconate aldolase [Streptosporangiales bacterium]